MRRAERVRRWSSGDSVWSLVWPARAPARASWRQRSPALHCPSIPCRPPHPHNAQSVKSHDSRKMSLKAANVLPATAILVTQPPAQAVEPRRNAGLDDPVSRLAGRCARKRTFTHRRTLPYSCYTHRIGPTKNPRNAPAPGFQGAFSRQIAANVTSGGKITHGPGSGSWISVSEFAWLKAAVFPPHCARSEAIDPKVEAWIASLRSQ